MKSSLNSSKKSRAGISKKVAVFLLVFVMLFSFLITPLNTAKAQIPVTDVLSSAWQIEGTVWQKITNTLKTLWQKAGSMAFQQVVRTALNKIAYDTANYLGSGGKGQQPLFITQDWGDYLTQIGDEAAGQFIENFAANLTSVNRNFAALSAPCQNEYQACANSCPESTADEIFNEYEEMDSQMARQECLTACKTAATKCSNAAAGTATASSTSADYMNSPSFNVCQPSSVEAKLKISLGLTEYQRPGAPNCTASEMIQNWGDEAKRLADYKDPDFLNKFTNIFNPVSNDLGIYMLARSDMIQKKAEFDENAKLNLAANKGWKAKTNIAKNAIGIPQDAEKKAEIAQTSAMNQIARTTGDIVVDAANVFLNQFAITGFNTLMSNLGKKTSEGSTEVVTKSESDPNVTYGEGALKEVTASIIKPDFGVRADYDILSALAVCPDAKNPGPTDCVIDNKLMQGITEKKTIIEAIENGYIHGEWSLAKDTIDNTYSLRNISILRKYRILPVGWEEAVNLAYADNNSIKKVTVMDLISCFDATDDYNQFSSDFNTRDQVWCRGLVDPNWVLKAPLNYCRRQGSGAQIVNKTVIPSLPGGIETPYTPSVLNITRGEDYCADEQTCIKEKDDGSCEVYGYCNEEKRTWNFSSASCEPVYNTCQSFTNTTTKKSFAYLENTLNYRGCNSESAGCRQYSLSGVFNNSNGAVDWQANKSIYFNKNILACNSKDEGCTELLRIKPTWGANLIMDADYSNDSIGASSTGISLLNDWPYWSSANTNISSRAATIVETSRESLGTSGKALKLEAARTAGESGLITVGTYSDLENSLLPDNFQVISGQSYTLSADVYLAEGNKVNIYLGRSSDNFVQSTAALNSWQHLSLTRIASGSFNEPIFSLNADSSGNTVKFYLKNVKFEVSNFENSFSAYGNYRIYEKLIPSYLEQACYIDATSAQKDYNLKSTAPAECSLFARKCNQSEVGCDLFTSVKNGLSVAAQVTSGDYCAKDCLGYDVYISKEDHFNSPQSENIIPANAQTCSAEAIGCSEFTNLDELSQGGENKEYYSALKQCIKPSESLCGSFYGWEGTESGYQLRAYSLQKTATGNPAVTTEDSALCNAAIYNKTVGDPLYNADCREFYNAAGQVSYHLISRTITCSDNCHAYRLSNTNVDKTLTAEQCASNPINRHWNTENNECYSCLNGGTWDNQLGACVYQAIPGEGKVCRANENGCREYNGNDGNNVRIIASYNFETGAQGWSSNCANGLQVTTIANNRNGHSLLYKDSGSSCSAIGQDSSSPVSRTPIIKQVLASANVAAQIKVSNLVTQGKSYSLRFIAKAASDTVPQIYFSNNETTDPKKSEFAVGALTIKGGNEWNIYQFSLDNLNHKITANEVLVITANQDFYFDDVVLTEITDRYYLLKGTSEVPDVCYYDISNVYQGEDYNLGCSQYVDRNNLIHNLHKFSKLCSNSAVGCEQMITTQNYAPYRSGIWNDLNKDNVCGNNEPDCVKVETDKTIYAIYDENKQCNSADLGCSRLGQGADNASAWSDVYKKNNPNTYSLTLCSQGELGCEEWTASDGTTNYFRDPGNEACQYRLSQDPLVTGKAWYKIPVKRCDLNSNGKIEDTEKSGEVCNSNNNCSDKPCIIDTNDYACSTSYFKTFGLGGSGNQISVPDQQAALCEANASGCTEYIDPVSQVTPNLIYNSNYELSGNTLEGWGSSEEKWQGASLNSNEQIVTIEPNKLYIFSVENSSGNLASGSSPAAATKSLEFLSGVRPLLANNGLGTTTTSISIPANTNKNIIFASLNNSKVKVTGGESGRPIKLKEAIINYQLQENIDKNSCNGVVNSDSGCILFNERQVNGGSLAGLTFDAASSTNKGAPINCQAADNTCTANQLIKVSPNRLCAKWLDCITYVQDQNTKERTCYAVGECTRLNDKNECANFENVVASTELTDQNKNASGYYLLAKNHLSNMKEVGLNSDAHYDFEDSLPALNCKRASGGTCVFNKNIVADLLVREPEKAPTDYPAHGASFLKVPSSYIISPHSPNNPVSILANKQYYVNFLVNTKNSGTKARITIKDGLDRDLVIKDVSSDNGWSRQIFSFNSGGATEVKIYLGTADTTNDRLVYFDDINIEPVLEIGTNQYISRECRLYPTNGSLTCVNKNNNVLKDGWEGYCLEHDPNNKDVCLLWYPVDSISSSNLSRTSSGYQGKFPLNYCTEVNGNFDLVNKREAYLLGSDNTSQNCNNAGARDNGFDTTGFDNLTCPPSYIGLYYAFDYFKPASVGVFNNRNCSIDYWCVPKNNGATYRVETLRDNVPDSPAYSIIGNFSGYKVLLSDRAKTIEGHHIDDARDNDEIVSRLVATSDGWYKYDGVSDKVDGQPALPDPPVRVYDYDREPADEAGLKLISGSDTDKIYRLTCNNFIQMVDSSGANKAWALRTGINSVWSTTTPPYFVDGSSYYGNVSGSTHKLSAYGRNRQDVPFGAALWPDSFDLLNSEAVKLRNQFSTKNNETVLAGRPFGCSNYKGETGTGCFNIGYCSLDPNVYCLVTNNSAGGTVYTRGTSTDYVARKTCAEGGLGVCLPIWNNYLGQESTSDYSAILKNLFLKSYNSYNFKDGFYSPGVISINSDPSACPGNTRPTAVFNNVSQAASSFCYVIPSITTPKIRYNNKIVPNIGKRGIYSVEFNTNIDPEQQPLKQIYIDWGDGSEQVITGQDSRPGTTNPHVFYHYYKEATTFGSIQIIDNWGKRATLN